MEFDRSKVYTALNADELKIGSEVLVDNCISTLKNQVADYKDSDAKTLIRICSENSLDGRFETITNIYHFAYLISEPKDWTVYICRMNPDNYYLSACRSDAWEEVQKDYGAKTKLFEGTEDEVDKWYIPRKHLINVIAAWEDGKTIQFFDDSIGDWADVGEPKWSIDTQYRIKPEGLKWTDLKIGDIIRYNNLMTMVTAIDDSPSTMSHIYGYDWISDDELEDYEKVE